MPKREHGGLFGWSILLAFLPLISGCLPTASEVLDTIDVQQSVPGEHQIDSNSDPLITVPASDMKVRTFSENGKLIDEIIVTGRPPVIYRARTAKVPVADVALGTNSLTSVPAFTWCYGCSATSAGMVMGYYDNRGYTNMYSGPANGGVCPMNNVTYWGSTSWPSTTCGESPLVATHIGKDGRVTRGHVEDYWIDYNNSESDPYIVGGWTEHTQGDCTGDYMGTNQSKYTNIDGGTTFYNYTDGSPLYDYTGGEPSRRDGCHGMKLFVQSRGYSVVTNFNQYIYGYNGNTQGFTFTDYMSEIDAGRPVLIQVSGHTMVGFGYNSTGNTVYLHDTWDNGNHSMTWGGSYSGMQHYAVTVLRLVAIIAPTAQDGSASAFSGTATSITLQATDDGQPNPPGALSYIITSLPSHGTLTDPGGGAITAVPYALISNGNQVSYTPVGGYIGADSFTFKANDGGTAPNGGDSNTATVSITVASVTVFLSEPFEASFVNGAPPGWSKSFGSSSVDWIRNIGDYSTSDASHGGTYNAMLYYSGTQKHETYLITPAINLGAGTTNTTLEFWHKQAIWSAHQDTLTVYYKTSAAGSWTQLASYTANVATWTKRTISLPNPSSTYYIGFLGNAKFGYGVCIDDVVVTGQSNVQLPGAPTMNTEPTYTAGATNPVSWTTVSGADQYYMEWDTNSSFSSPDGGSGWTAGTSFTAVTLTNGQMYYYHVKTRNAAGESAWSNTVSSTQDASPPTGTIAINSGAAYATNTAVTLTLSATDVGSGIQQMRFSNDSSTWSTWEAYATSKSWTLATGDGTKTVFVQYRDNVGNQSSSFNDTITLDLTAPSGTVVINSGAETTNSTAAMLTLSASDTNGVAQMRVSNDGSIWSDWEAYATSKSWTLPAGDGPKTVYVQFTDNAGNSSGSFTDTITLDQTVPVIASESPVRYSSLGSLPSVSVTFSEAVTDVSADLLTVNGSPATGVTGSGIGPYVFSGYAAPPTGTITVALASGTIRDAAGSLFAGDNWTYDLIAVTISGYVRNAEGWNIFHVEMAATNGGGTTTTDGNGYYELTVPYDWSGTITPSKPDWHFTSPAVNYSHVTSSVSTDYTATPDHISGDANGDGGVGFSDYLILSSNYGSSGEWANGDFNGDGAINFSDYLLLQTNYIGK